MKRGNVLCFMICSLVLTCLCTSGCAGIGMAIGGVDKEYHMDKIIKLKHSTPNILDIAADAGKELGYRVAGSDESTHSVVLATDLSFFQVGLLGKSDMTRMSITKTDDKTVAVELIIIGNFGVAEEENVKKTYQQFEQKLLSKI